MTRTTSPGWYSFLGFGLFSLSLMRSRILFASASDIGFGVGRRLVVPTKPITKLRSLTVCQVASIISMRIST